MAQEKRTIGARITRKFGRVRRHVMGRRLINIMQLSPNKYTKCLNTVPRLKITF